MRIQIVDEKRHENSFSGYGKIARCLVEEFQRMGISVGYSLVDSDINLWLSPPYALRKGILKGPNVVFTMHELETLPDGKRDWPSLLSKTDAVITPSEWNREMWIKEGVKVPIYVVSLGIDPEIYHGFKTKEFSILTMHENLGSDSSRENWRDTIEAYIRAFRGKTDTVLNMKSWRMKPIRTKEWIEQVKERYSILDDLQPEINIIEREMTEEELNDFLARHWLFIKSANREGWCLPVNEALGAGVPIVATAIEPLLTWLPKEKVTFYPLGDVGILMEILMEFYDKYERERGLRYKYTWRATASQLLEIFGEIIK